MILAHYGFWLASRAAGITAYVLLSLSVTGGLLLALRRVPPKLRRTVQKAHERIAVLALASIALHGLLLLGDATIRPALWQILVPFAFPYQPLFVGLGVLAGYGAAALGLTFYARRRLGGRRWRMAHRFIPVFWGMAVVHVLGAGTDALSLWLLGPLAWTVLVAVWLLIDRWGPSGAPARGRRPGVAPRPETAGLR